VQVQRNLVRGVLTTPKNHQRRRVDLSHQLTAALRLWRRQQRAAWLAVGRPFPDWVFSSPERHSTNRTCGRRSTASSMARACIVVARIRCGTRSRRCCCRKVRRSRTSATNSGIAIRRSRCACTRTGCLMRRAPRSSIGSTTRSRTAPRRHQRRRTKKFSER
jgi:hypothetical protein